MQRDDWLGIAEEKAGAGLLCMASSMRPALSQQNPLSCQGLKSLGHHEGPSDDQDGQRGAGGLLIFFLP